MHRNLSKNICAEYNLRKTTTTNKQQQKRTAGMRFGNINSAHTICFNGLWRVKNLILIILTHACDNLKQNEVQSASADSTNKGVN